MNTKAFRKILDRHHRKLAKDVQAMLTEAGDYYRKVDREHPDDTDLTSHTLNVYNEIHELKDRIESFRATWID